MFDSSGSDIQATLQQSTTTLAAAGIDTARLDAELLLAHCLQVGRTHLLAHPEQLLTPEQFACFQALAQRRAGREPLAYLTGRRWFYALEFAVTPDALIPRPETELLVEKAVRWLGQRHGRKTRVLDVGTGSGAIAVSVAAHAAPEVELLASDVSAESLQIAKQNARKHGVAGRITFLLGDLLDPLPEPVHLILSNPPYIASAVIPTLMPEVRDHEPRAALDGGPDGLRVIERLLAQAPVHLRPGGAIFLEIGYDQGPAAGVIARQYFPTAAIRIHQDLAGLDRVVEVQTGG